MVMIVVAWAMPARSQDQGGVPPDDETRLATMGRAPARHHGARRGRRAGRNLADVVVARPTKWCGLAPSVAWREAAGGRQRYEAARAARDPYRGRNGSGAITIDDGNITLEVDPRPTSHI
jgi:hypothetical protein